MNYKFKILKSLNIDPFLPTGRNSLKITRLAAKRENFKLKILFISLCALNTYFLILDTKIVHAQGVSLKIAPSLLQLRVRPPTEINAPIVIENLSSDVVDLEPQFKLFKASPKANGEIEYLDDTRNKIDFFKSIKLLDGDKAINSLSLNPRQKKQLSLNIPVDSDLEGRDFYFSLIFVATPKSTPINASSEKTSFVKINSGVAMNMILSIVKGATNDTKKDMPDADLEEFKTPTFTENGPVPFTIKMKNNSNQYITPKGTITVKNMFGQVFEKVELQPSTILGGSSRYLENTDQSSIINHQSSISKTVWPESFLLGFYEAQLKVEVSPGGEVLTETIRFAAFPIRLAVGLIAGLILLTSIYKRVKAKMNER